MNKSDILDLASLKSQENSRSNNNSTTTTSLPAPNDKQLNRVDLDSKESTKGKYFNQEVIILKFMSKVRNLGSRCFYGVYLNALLPKSPIIWLVIWLGFLLTFLRTAVLLPVVSFEKLLSKYTDIIVYSN
jgi:hypothetical protein